MRQLQAVPQYPGPLVLAPIGTQPLSHVGPLRRKNRPVLLYTPGDRPFDQDAPIAS